MAVVTINNRVRLVFCYRLDNPGDIARMTDIASIAAPGHMLGNDISHVTSQTGRLIDPDSIMMRFAGMAGLAVLIRAVCAFAAANCRCYPVLVDFGAGVRMTGGARLFPIPMQFVYRRLTAHPILEHDMTGGTPIHKTGGYPMVVNRIGIAMHNTMTGFAILGLTAAA